MSQLKAAAAATAAAATSSAPSAPTSLPGRAARPTSPRPRLTVVPPARAPIPRAPFVLLVSGLLTAGLIGLLFLHTAIAEDSFRVHDLTARSVVLADRAQALEQEIALAAAPQRLAMRAEALGMVRSENPVFIRTSDGRILGKPKPGSAPPVKVTRAPATEANARPSTSPPKPPKPPKPRKPPNTPSPTQAAR